MRKFILTSQKFAGAVALYYQDEYLVTLDMAEAAMQPMQRKKLLEGVPVTVGELDGCFGGRVMVVEADYEVAWKDFYTLYPHKRNAYRAEKEWQKMPKPDQVRAYVNVKQYADYCRRNTWYSAMLADRYLKERHWDTDWRRL